MADDPQMDQMLRAALRRRPGAAEADPADGVCLDAETFAAWSSGALLEIEEEAIERHLSTCARCQEMAAIFVRSEPPVSTTTLVAFKPRWSFRWIGPIAAAAAAGVTWFVWPVRPQTVPPKEETTVSRAEPKANPAEAPPPGPAGLPPASTPSAPAAHLERVAPVDEEKRMAQARGTPPGAQPKNQGQDARDADARSEAGRARLTDPQAVGGARAVPIETRADTRLATAPIQAPTVAAKPTPPPPSAPVPTPPTPPATDPPPAGTVAGGIGPGMGGGAARAAGTGPPPPPVAAPGGVVGGVVGGVPTRAEDARQQPTFRAAMDAATVVAEFSSGSISAETIVGGAGAGRGGGGRGGGGGAATAPAAKEASLAATPRWRILSSGSVERSTDGGRSWQPLVFDQPIHIIAGTSPSPATCWLIGRGGVVLLSIDGVRFARVPFGPATELTSIRATSARDATVTTPDGREFVTNDGGATWRARD